MNGQRDQEVKDTIYRAMCEHGYEGQRAFSDQIAEYIIRDSKARQQAIKDQYGEHV